MVPSNKSLILNSYCTKWIVCKNVWKFNLKTIAMTIVLCDSYALNVQILSTHQLKISSLIWLIGIIGIVFINSIHICITYKISTSLLTILKMKSPCITQSIIEVGIKSRPNSCLLRLQFLQC